VGNRLERQVNIFQLQYTTPPLLEKHVAKVKAQPVNAVKIPNKSLVPLMHLNLISNLVGIRLDLLV